MNDAEPEKDTLEKIYRDYHDLALFKNESGMSRRLVEGSGPLSAKVMFIGEAPGANEDKTGIPFSGAAGEIFNSLLGSIGLNREEVFVTNIFKYRPPNNRTPFIYEITKSIKFMTREVAVVNPMIIVPMGRRAISAFFPGQTVRGGRAQNPLAKNGKIIISTLHPASLFYGEEDAISRKRNQIEHDFRIIRSSLAKMQEEAKSGKRT